MERQVARKNIIWWHPPHKTAAVIQNGWFGTLIVATYILLLIQKVILPSGGDAARASIHKSSANLITATYRLLSEDMKMDSIKLIKYNHAVRRGYLKKLAELPWNEIVKDRGASFPSIRDIFLHAVNAEDLLINRVAQGRQMESPPRDYSEFVDMHQIEARVNEVEEKVDAYLKTLTQQELERKVPMPWKKSLLLEVNDVLITLALEDTYHMGELNALMWQSDIEPPWLSWAKFIEQNP